jgi:CDP-diacylglycerol--glycerol-3-phosphate 3-phosphatidyltransferase
VNFELTQIRNEVTIPTNVTTGDKEYGLFGLPELGRFWTVSNLLSIVRAFLTIPVVYLILIREPGEPASLALLLLVAIAIVTDWFDGKIARWSSTVSDWGKFLDPLADKIAAGFTVLALGYTNQIPWWFVILMITRDWVTGIGWSYLSRRTGQFLMSRLSGKAATFAVSITVLAALLVADPEIMVACIWITTTLLLYSFVDYFVHFVVFLRQHGRQASGSDLSDPHPQITDTA